MQHFAPHFHERDAKPWIQRYTLTNKYGEVYWSGNEVPNYWREIMLAAHRMDHVKPRRPLIKYIELAGRYND